MKAQIQEAHTASVDASTVCTIALRAVACDADPVLLDLQAGGRRRSRNQSRDPASAVNRMPSPNFQRSGSPFRSPDETARKRREALDLPICFRSTEYLKQLAVWTIVPHTSWITSLTTIGCTVCPNKASSMLITTGSTASLSPGRHCYQELASLSIFSLVSTGEKLVPTRLLLLLSPVIAED